MSAQVFDGTTWQDVGSDTGGHTGSQSPVPPVLDGNGQIFVSIVSFRDSRRCADTIRNLFENAQDPDNIVVGLVEHVTEDEDHCLEVYCKHYELDILKRRKIRADTTKVVIEQNVADKCPRYKDQIRLLGVHNIAAKGPNMSRALTRKILGNEEFCLQIDAHTSFVTGWDAKLKQEWTSIGNEFGILSTAPASMDEQSDYAGSKLLEVPRQCAVQFADNGIPNFHAPADGKAVNLKKPLLGHSWSSGFSFAKCHLEESAPYDPFARYIMAAEQFPRFARFWTRGYDVYTPTQNIVFHDYKPNAEGHDSKEWAVRRRDRQRKAALHRFKTFLEIPGGETSQVAKGNLGLYGLGKRRSLQQLNDFLGISLSAHKDNSANTRCGDHDWVPYDTKISPVENLITQADDLDPQPEFPLRTELVYYKMEEQPAPALELGDLPEKDEISPQETPIVTSNAPPTSMLVTLWAFGLIVWCLVFVNRGQASKPKLRKKGGTSGYKNV